MASVLEIKTDPTEQADAQSASTAAANELSMQDLPGYLVEEESTKTPVALSIVAVLFFLLCTAGVAAGTQYYLIPESAKATEELDAITAQQTVVSLQITKEQKKGEEHIAKLEKVQKTLTAPEQRRVADVLVELQRIAQNVAQGARSADGSFVTIGSIGTTPDGKVSISGSVDGYLTLADWVEQLEASPIFEGIKVGGASLSGDEGNASVPYNYTFSVVSASSSPLKLLGGAVKSATEPASSAPSAAPVSSAPPASSVPPVSSTPPSSSLAPSSAPASSIVPSSAPSLTPIPVRPSLAPGVVVPTPPNA